MKIKLNRHLLFKGNDVPYKVFFVSASIFLLIFVLLQSFSSLASIVTSSQLLILSKLKLSYFLFWDSLMALSLIGKLLLTITAIVGGLNTSLLYIYFNNRAGSIGRGGVFSSFGTLMAFVGFGCGTCGGLLLSYLSFFPAAYLPFVIENNVLLVLGIVIMISSTILLSSKLAEKNTC